jgi:hypothetical protein
MRFITAVILFVISASMILLGLAERTIWHPPASHVQVLQLKTNAPLIIVKNSALKLFPGQPTLTVSSPSKPFLGVGRQTDIDAWVGGTSHIEVSGLPGGKGTARLVSQVVQGTQISAAPQGSDLWRSEKTEVGKVTQVVDTRNHTAVLLANNGYDPAPSEIRFSWDIVFDPAPSRNLLIIGFVFLVAALVVNVWAWYHMRKTRGPRRRTPRAPQGPKTRRRRTSFVAPSKGRRAARTFTASASGLVILAALTGCSTYAPISSPSATATQIAQAPAVVTIPQLRTIIKRVASHVAAADTAKDARLLTTRVAGPALASRSAYYTLEKASKEIPPLKPIPTATIRLALPAQTTQWPRIVMAITSSGNEKDLPQLLVLEQQTPRDPYMLWYDIDMLPGVKLPVVNQAKTGAIEIAPDSQFLKISPDALPTAFGDLIDNGPASNSASQFDVSKDEFYSQIRASQLSQQQNLSSATIKVTHTLGNPNVLSLSTASGGALVAVYLTDQYVITPKDRTHAVAVAGNEKLMLGQAGSAKGIKSTYGTMLLFYNPATASKDKIKTLGATQTLLSVRSL